MDTLIVSQTIFYIVSSTAIIIVAVLLGIAIWQLIKILKSTRKVSEDLGATYNKAKRGVKKIISLVSDKK